MIREYYSINLLDSYGKVLFHNGKSRDLSAELFHQKESYEQVLAFQKSWRSFSPITVCIIAQCQCRTGGEAGGMCPYPQRRGRGECPNFFFAHLYVR